jgi:phosphoserine phosphatase
VFDVVFFDCDSTLSTLEGIDELAREAGALEEFAALTRDAMAGRVRLEDIYGRRLERVRPSRRSLERVAAVYCETIVTGAPETIAALQAAGSEVHVVSGGLLPAVRAVALKLGVPEQRVHAVDLSFDESGAYAGFDESSPLARSGGKTEICGSLLAGRRGAIVGDGITDAEAAPPCELFVGFGGVAARDAVRERAGAWVPGPSLAGVLDHLLSEDERRRAADGSA